MMNLANGGKFTIFFNICRYIETTELRPASKFIKIFQTVCIVEIFNPFFLHMRLKKQYDPG